MIIKIIGLFLLTMGMFALGYVCGVIMTGLKYETGETVYGFDCLWNEGNPHMSKLPIIKEG